MTVLSCCSRLLSRAIWFLALRFLIVILPMLSHPNFFYLIGCFIPIFLFVFCYFVAVFLPLGSVCIYSALCILQLPEFQHQHNLQGCGDLFLLFLIHNLPTSSLRCKTFALSHQVFIFVLWTRFLGSTPVKKGFGDYQGIYSLN